MAATYTGRMRCTVFGTGYLGATHAVGMAQLGHEVIGVDIDPGKVAKLAAGDIPFYEPGLRELLTDNLAAGRLRFTTDYDLAADFADVHFLGVGTPQKKGEYGADLSHVHAVIDNLVPRLTRAAVLVGKSTVPVGTAAELVERAAALAPPGVDVEIAWNPEFLREGHAVHDTLEPDRIVLGIQQDSVRSEMVIRELYAPLLDAGVPFLVTDLQTAELAKVSANAFLATKISFINEIANLCDQIGCDVHDVARAMGMDRRIGNKFLHPGPGYGGSCFPKDTRALAAVAKEFGASSTIVDSVIEVNLRQRELMVTKIERQVGDLEGKAVTILGLSFKPETDDMRDAPSVDIIKALQAKGALITAYDPVAMDEARKVFPDLKYSTDEYAAVNGADALIFITEWNQFRALDMERVRTLMRSPKIVDLRNIYTPVAMREMGFDYVGVGR